MLIFFSFNEIKRLTKKKNGAFIRNDKITKYILNENIILIAVQQGALLFLRIY